jgi:Tol biopolymer transport system component
MLVWERREAMHERIPESQVVVARADGLGARPIATGTDPSWSPDGRLILFKTPEAGTGTLWVSTVAPSGGEVKKLARGVHPHWSPDGQRIAYMLDRVDGGADIWIMNRDGSGRRCLTCAAPFR